MVADLGLTASTEYDWKQQTDTFAVNALTPTTTIPIWIKSTATSSIAGSLEAWGKIGSPYFNATSTTATSTFAGGVRVGGGLNVSGLSGIVQAVNGDLKNGATTDNLSEGATNLYYTTARVNTDAPNVTLGTTNYSYLSLSGQAITLLNAFSTTSAAHWLLGNLAPFNAASIFSTSTATSTYAGGLRITGGLTATQSVEAPAFIATSTTATSTFSGGLSAKVLNTTTATSTLSGLIIASSGLQVTNLVCNGLGNNGKLTTDSQGNVFCSADLGLTASTEYDWKQQTDTFAVNALTPTTTIPIWIKSTATSSIAGSLEAWGKIGSPYFNATSTTATSTFAGGVRVGGGLNVSGLSGIVQAVNGDLKNGATTDNLSEGETNLYCTTARVNTEAPNDALGATNYSYPSLSGQAITLLNAFSTTSAAHWLLGNLAPF